MHAEHADGARLNELSERVIGCAFNVMNTLGVGFLQARSQRSVSGTRAKHRSMAAGLCAASGHLRVPRASAGICV